MQIIIVGSENVIQSIWMQFVCWMILHGL